MSCRSMGSFIFAIFVAISGNAADLTVTKGEPLTVSANASYSYIYASDKITINDNVNLTASTSTDGTYTLKADAEADATGHVDAIRIGAGAKFVISHYMQNANSATGVVTFAGTGATFSRSSNNWDQNLFSSGAWELVDETGTGINIVVPGSWKGGGFNKAGISVRVLGSGNVTVTAGWTTDKANGVMYFNKGFTFANSGNVNLIDEYQSTYLVNCDNLFAPSVSSVNLWRNNYKGAPVSLNVASGKVAAIKNLTAYDGGCCEGAGTIQMGGDDSNGTLKANIRGDTLTIEKVGSGTLTVPVCTNIPVLSVKGGSVVLKTTMPVGKLFIASGASVTIDGGTVTVGSVEGDSMMRVSCTNGGKLIFRTSSDSDESLRDVVLLTDSMEFCKVGSGKTILCANSCADSGFYNLKAGEVVFSKRGLPDKFLRFTFKKVLGWINYDSKLSDPGPLRLKQIALFGTDGSRALNELMSYTSEHDGYTADKLAKGEVSVPSGTIFKTTSEVYDNTPKGLFYTDQGWWPTFNNNNLDDADDPTKWQEVTVRLPDAVPSLDGYSFQANYCNGLPTTWKIESSATGEDGSWRVIADEADKKFDAVANNHNAGWLDGYASKGDGDVSDTTGRLAMYFNYIEPGVASVSGDGATVTLENGAILDASSITDGLGVKKINYDCALGGGTLKNVRFAAAGRIDITGASGSPRPAIAISVSNPVDADNLSGWSVYVDGVKSKSVLRVIDGTLALQLRGTVLLLR